MTEKPRKNVLDEIYKIASESDGAVILTYSLTRYLIETIYSKLKEPKEIRIMYSVKTDAQKAILQLKNLGDLKKKSKALEIYGDLDHFETSHAKIYLFCKSGQEYIDLTIILGSFNLTLETLRNIEVYAVYKLQVNRNFLIKNKIKHFIEIFNINGQLTFDLKSLRENISGIDREIGYEIILMLLQLWFINIPIVTDHLIDEYIDFFKEEKRRVFVSTWRNNSLLMRFIDLLRSAFIYANENGKDVELIVVTPFHTEKAIKRLFLLKKQVLKSIGLEGKIKFSFKLLTNNFSVIGDIDKSSYTNPMALRELMFDSEYSNEFRVKFWGYTSGNEDFIHAKIYLIKVGEKKVFLITSANLTLSGFGFDSQKNLEVGVIENRSEQTEMLYKYVMEWWDSEEAITSKENRIWNELLNWYEKLEESEEKIEKEFEINGLTDFYIYKNNRIEVRDKKGREIELMKLLISFSRKEKPVKNLERKFEKRGDIFYAEFSLKEKHLGPAFCDIIAKLVDGSYIFITQQKVNVIEKFPNIKITLSPVTNIQRNLMVPLIPIEVKIETGRGITKIDLTKISFQLNGEKMRTIPKIFLIKEKIENVRILQFLLWVDAFEITKDVYLDLLYENEKKAICKIPQNFVKRIFQKTGSDEKIISFLKHRSIHILTDRRTLCPKVKTEIKLNVIPNVIALFKVNKIIVIQDFIYSELIGMKRNRKQSLQEFQFKRKIRLSNNFQIHLPADVEVWVYGVRKEDQWTLWIPIGKLEYQLFRNPPDLEILDKSPLKTNVTPIKIEFNLKGANIYWEKAIFEYRIHKFKEKHSIKKKNIVCNLPEKISIYQLKEGIDLKYRFIFKYNVADILGKLNIKYDLFVSFPHPTNPEKSKMLIYELYNPRDPCSFWKMLSEGILRDKLPHITVTPIHTSNFKIFYLSLNKDSLKSVGELLQIKKGKFVLKKLSQEILTQLQSRNITKFEVIIHSKISQHKVAIPVDILYLEGVKTDLMPMKKGGYGKSITIYYPDEYKNEFKEYIVKIIPTVYSQYLNKYNINDIRRGEYSWIISEEEKERVIREIETFIRNKVKSKTFTPNFEPKRTLHPSEIRTLPYRRIIDFIIFIRRGKHQLQIKINEQ